MKNGMSVKIITSLVILTALIIISSLYAHKLLYDDSVKLANTIDEILKSTRSGSWEQAEDKIRRLNSDWGSIKRTWSSLIDHQEIDNIDVTLARLEILIEARDSSLSMSEAAALKRFINHIPEKESLSRDNVF